LWHTHGVPREAFELFGVSHLVALAVIAALGVGGSLWMRRDRDRRQRLPTVVAVVLLGAGVIYPLIDLAMGRSWREVAPLHICDVVVFIGAVALQRRRQLAYELLYFWGGVGTTAALLTPDLHEAFPSYRFIFYFLQHGAIVVAALVLTVGAGMRPRRWGVLYAFGWLNAYAALVFGFDDLFDANFLYLRGAPGSTTPLDWFGPWPWYILGGELVAISAFVLLALPFRRSATVASPR
jgi:hypothetical integral membrane protein (TIGR02206 family)